MRLRLIESRKRVLAAIAAAEKHGQIFNLSELAELAGLKSKEHARQVVGSLRAAGLVGDTKRTVVIECLGLTEAGRALA